MLPCYGVSSSPQAGDLLLVSAPFAVPEPTESRVKSVASGCTAHWSLHHTHAFITHNQQHVAVSIVNCC